MCGKEWRRIRYDGLDVLFSSRRRHTRFDCDWSSDVCSSDLPSSRSPRPARAVTTWPSHTTPNCCTSRATRSTWPTCRPWPGPTAWERNKPGPPASAARVVSLMQLAQALARHMGINGGGRDIGMAQQQLHHAQIGAMVEQMRGKGVAQGVR